MSLDAMKEAIRAVFEQAEAEGRALVVDFTDGERDIFEPDGLEVADDFVVVTDSANRRVQIPYEHIAEMTVYMDVEETDDIVEIREVPGGASVRFAGGVPRALLGRTVADIEREIGRVGDRVPRRRFVAPKPAAQIIPFDLDAPRRGNRRCRGRQS